MTVFLILCPSSDVFWEKLKLFMTFPVPSGKPWAGSKGVFQEQQRDVSGWDSPLWIMALLNLSGRRLGVEGSVWHFCIRSSWGGSLKPVLAGQLYKGNWYVPHLLHLSITLMAVCLNSVPCKANLSSVLQGWHEPPNLVAGTLTHSIVLVPN